MKRFLSAALGLSMLIATGFADSIVQPKEKPLVLVNVPKSWSPENTDDGIAIESPDKVATLFVEATTERGLKPLLEKNMKWLVDDQGVVLDLKTKSEKSYTAGNREWNRVCWNGKEEEFGPALIGFMFTPIGNGKILTVTYWITEKDMDKHLPTLDSILNSVREIQE